MALLVRVDGGIVRLRCVPLSAAQADKLYQVVYKTGEPGPFVHLSDGPERLLKPLPEGVGAADVSHLVEYPLPDAVCTSTEALEAPTAPQVVEFLRCHEQEDVVVRMSPAEASARVSMN